MTSISQRIAAADQRRARQAAERAAKPRTISERIAAADKS